MRHGMEKSYGNVILVGLGRVQLSHIILERLLYWLNRKMCLSHSIIDQTFFEVYERGTLMVSTQWCIEK